MCSTFRLVVLLALVIAPGAYATGASFRGLGDFEGGDAYSVATGITWDGQMVVGTAYSDVSHEPFTWTPGGGMQRLDNILTVITPGGAEDVSSDGRVVVGRADFGNVNAFRWRDAGFTMFGQAPSVANGVGADGSIVVGTENYSPGGGPAPVTGTAYRWTESGGVSPLGDLPGGDDCSRASDVSADGRVIVGVGDCGSSFQVEDLGTAVRWVDGQGAASLGYLPGGFLNASRATAVSLEGNAIVGASSSASGIEPFIWTEADGMVGLGQLPGATYGSAEAVSSLGRFVVGSSGDKAFMWTEHLGMIDVQEMLSRNPNLDLKGWTLTSATAISPDGIHLAGEGINPEGNPEAWWAELFRFPDDDDDGGNVDLDDLNNVRNNFGRTGAGVVGDMPLYDGIVDLHDLNYVRNHFSIDPEDEPIGVPEPRSWWLSLIVLIGVGLIRTRN